MIKKKTENGIVIDLTGPEGNAFCLLGYAGKYAKQLGMDEAKVREKMTSGDYENLVKVFDDLFGNFVTLLR